MIMDRPDTTLTCDLCPSPNHGERRVGRKPDAIILHYTGMPTAEGAIERLCDPASEVSCHYLVLEDGRLVQLVSEARRAWHAGAGSWKGETDINSASIGIEIVNFGHDGNLPPYPPRQIEAIAALCSDIAARHAIAPERILAHSDVAPRRKRDPGEHFPWRHLNDLGVGHYVTPDPPRDGGLGPGDRGEAVLALQTMLAHYGYSVSPSAAFDTETFAVLNAFQRHFRQQRVDGIADLSTIETLRKLVDALDRQG